jgi:pimeloyl-ACP methyl ester carboxylesterase
MTTRAVTASAVGNLHVAQWPGMSGTVLALPGVGSAHPVWTYLAEQLPNVRVVAPDLRGRGGSWRVGGPYGLRQHARDLATVAAELDLRDVVVVGHSMGAFLAPVVAAELGDRVSRLVLIDGGLPPRRPFWMRRAVVKRLFSLGVRRLDKVWPDADAYAKAVMLKSFDSRPELRAQMAAACAYDLADDGRPRIDFEAIVTDAVDTFFGPAVVPALEQLTIPAHLLWASAGRDDGARPMYTADAVATWQARLPTLTTERVAANHATLVFAPEVITAVRG